MVQVWRLGPKIWQSLECSIDCIFERHVLIIDFEVVETRD